MRAFHWIAGLVLAAALDQVSSAARPGKEEWQATSTASMGITGDILLSPTRLRMAEIDFPLRLVADVPRFEGLFGPVPARVLAVRTPKNPVLLNGNRLCRAPVRWIVVSHTRNGDLEFDAFSSMPMPTSVRSPGSCGVLFYSRPAR